MLVKTYDMCCRMCQRGRRSGFNLQLAACGVGRIKRRQQKEEGEISYFQGQGMSGEGSGRGRRGARAEERGEKEGVKT